MLVLVVRSRVIVHVGRELARHTVANKQFYVEKYAALRQKYFVLFYPTNSAMEETDHHGPSFSFKSWGNSNSNFDPDWTCLHRFCFLSPSMCGPRSYLISAVAGYLEAGVEFSRKLWRYKPLLFAFWCHHDHSTVFDLFQNGGKLRKLYILGTMT